MEGQSDTEDVWKFRKLWREGRDADACLEIIPEHLGYEKSILESLSEKPEDWLAAFKRLPNSLQLLCVHSLQSLAFNHALAARMDSGHSLIEPILGDLVAPLHANGRIDVSKLAEVTESNLDRCRRNCKLGRLTVTGPLPGLDSQIALGQARRNRNHRPREIRIDRCQLENFKYSKAYFVRNSSTSVCSI